MHFSAFVPVFPSGFCCLLSVFTFCAFLGLPKAASLHYKSPQTNSSLSVVQVLNPDVEPRGAMHRKAECSAFWKLITSEPAVFGTSIHLHPVESAGLLQLLLPSGWFPLTYTLGDRSPHYFSSIPSACHHPVIAQNFFSIKTSLSVSLAL